MAQIIPIGQIMRPDTFEVSVHDRAQFSHMVIFTDHIRERMQERDVSTRQVLNVLRKGSICEDPVFDEGTQSHTGKLVYHGTGRDLTVACAIREGELTVVSITVY